MRQLILQMTKVSSRINSKWVATSTYIMFYYLIKPYYVKLGCLSRSRGAASAGFSAKNARTTGGSAVINRNPLATHWEGQLKLRTC